MSLVHSSHKRWLHAVLSSETKDATALVAILIIGRGVLKHKRAMTRDTSSRLEFHGCVTYQTNLKHFSPKEILLFKTEPAKKLEQNNLIDEVILIAFIHACSTIHIHTVTVVKSCSNSQLL